MPPCFTLDLLPRGESAIITKISTRGAMRRRLMELGFIPGAEITALYRGFFGGPAAYLINGAVIAIRNEDAAELEIARCI